MRKQTSKRDEWIGLIVTLLTQATLLFAVYYGVQSFLDYASNTGGSL